MVLSTHPSSFWQMALYKQHDNPTKLDMNYFPDDEKAKLLSSQVFIVCRHSSQKSIDNIDVSYDGFGTITSTCRFRKMVGSLDPPPLETDHITTQLWCIIPVTDRTIKTISIVNTHLTANQPRFYFFRAKKQLTFVGTGKLSINCCVIWISKVPTLKIIDFCKDLNFCNPDKQMI